MKGGYLLLTLAAVMASSVAHVLLKSAARRGEAMLTTWLNVRSLAAYSLFACAVIATTYALRELEYGVVVALSSLGFPLVALFSVFLLKESLTPRFASAQALVCCGVVVFCLPT